MERYRKDFSTKLNGFDFNTLENSKHSIYGLSKDLNLIYMNPSWVHFFKENNVEENGVNKFPIGTPIIKALRGREVKDFYLQNYQRVFETGKVWRHEYQCSSGKEFRQFHQSVHPLKDGDGLIVINSLTVNFSIDRKHQKAHDIYAKNYTQSTGFITQCSNCRNCQRVDQEDVWDWIPEWVEIMPSNVSHSICPICFDYYWKY
jgi:hypothetical protein